MAKPILIVKINHREYTEEQIKAIRDVLKSQMGTEYNTVFISSNKVEDISFEVHGGSL